MDDPADWPSGHLFAILELDTLCDDANLLASVDQNHIAVCGHNMIQTLLTMMKYDYGKWKYD